MQRSPQAVAHIQYGPPHGWQEFTWASCAREVARWQRALDGLGLAAGERVAILLRNCREWVIFDQAALGLGYATVPLYPGDRPENVGYILEDSGARLLLLEDVRAWERLGPIHPQLRRLDAVIVLRGSGPFAAPNLRTAADWLPPAGVEGYGGELARDRTQADGLASIVYTSGTTGRPKGVMLSHRNFLFDVQGCLDAVAVDASDRLLSLLPLSHTLERTVGYYAAVAAGIAIGYARSPSRLAIDLLRIRPTILIGVPRVFEQLHDRVRDTLAQAPWILRRLFAQALDTGWQAFLHRQGRAPWSAGLLLHPLLDRVAARPVRTRLGGRLRFAISGGAPLAEEVGRFFVALGIPVLQGYGLTESSPVISVNRLEDNEPATVGPALPGIEVRVGPQDELWTRSPAVMAGYWNDPQATRDVLDRDGWLHTGDQGAIGPRGHLSITGRVKHILVLSNGEKVAPADLERALSAYPLVEQVMVVGEGRPFLAALIVLRPGALEQLVRAAGAAPEQASTAEGARTLRRNPAVLEQALGALQPRLARFPGYLRLRAVLLMDEPWTVENGLLTPTLELRRGEILARWRERVDALYQGK